MNKHAKGSNQHAYKHRYHFWASIWFIALLTLLGALFFKLTEPKIISPIPESYIVEQVQAVEPKYNVRDVITRVAGSSAQLMLKIAKCESGYRTNVISKTWDIGLFQINLASHANRIPGTTKTEKTKWLQNAENNTIFAMLLLRESGVNAWNASSKCWK